MGFATPLVRGMATLFIMCVVSCDVRDGGGVALTPAAGVTARGTNAGGGGATGAGWLAAGATGATIRNGGAPRPRCHGGGRRGLGVGGNFDSLGAGAKRSGDVFGNFHVLLHGAA